MADKTDGARDKAMSEPRWTKGPWTVRRSMWTANVPADGFGIYAPDRKRQICGNNQNDPGDGAEPFMTWPELEANATLIAAAHALYEALKELLAPYGDMEPEQFAPDAARRIRNGRAALKAAEGEQP